MLTFPAAQHTFVTLPLPADQLPHEGFQMPCGTPRSFVRNTLNIEDIPGAQVGFLSPLSACRSRQLTVTHSMKDDSRLLASGMSTCLPCHLLRLLYGVLVATSMQSCAPVTP